MNTGPTEPNRLYSWMATSQGLGNDDADRLVEGFVGPNMFAMVWFLCLVFISQNYVFVIYFI